MEIPGYGRYAREDWPNPEKGYAAMVTLFDKEVGDILDRLQELGLADNTIVFLTSDNGPHSEGGHDAAFFNSAGPLRGIKRDLYEGGIREPLIVRWPGHVAAGAVSDQVGYFGDFLPTAAEIAGVRPPDHLDGISLLPAILGRAKDQQARNYLYWEFYEGASSQAVRWGDWKAVRIPMLTGKIELYDLAADLGEKHDVAATHPDVVAHIRGLMEEAPRALAPLETRRPRQSRPASQVTASGQPAFLWAGFIFAHGRRGAEQGQNDRGPDPGAACFNNG